MRNKVIKVFQRDAPFKETVEQTVCVGGPQFL